MKALAQSAACAVIFLALTVGVVSAHSWYPSECCSSSDCEMLSAREIRRDDTAWLLPNGERIPFEAARKSLDGEFHWCRYRQTPTEPVIKPTDRAPCLFIPDGGV